MSVPLSGHKASIVYVARAGGHYRWECEHTHRTEVAAFACASREARRRFAPAWPRTDIEAFNVMTGPVWNEP
jgi:hypothetical protein